MAVLSCLKASARHHGKLGLELSRLIILTTALVVGYNAAHLHRLWRSHHARRVQVLRGHLLTVRRPLLRHLGIRRESLESRVLGHLREVWIHS